MGLTKKDPINLSMQKSNKFDATVRHTTQDTFVDDISVESKYYL